MRTHGAVVGRLFRSVTKLTTKVRIGRGYLWGSFLIAAAALETPTRNGYNARSVNLKFQGAPLTLPNSTFGSVPCACVLVSPLYYKPSVMLLKCGFSLPMWLTRPFFFLLLLGAHVHLPLHAG